MFCESRTKHCILQYSARQFLHVKKSAIRHGLVKTHRSASAGSVCSVYYSILWYNTLKRAQKYGPQKLPFFGEFTAVCHKFGQQTDLFDIMPPARGVGQKRTFVNSYHGLFLADTILDRRLRTSPHSLRMKGIVNTARNSFHGCTLFILLSTWLVLPQVTGQSAPWSVWTCEGNSTSTYQAPTSEAGCCKWTGAWDGAFTTDARQCGSHTGTDRF